jgi:hypothetical protein
MVVGTKIGAELGPPEEFSASLAPFFIRFGTGCSREARRDGRMADTADALHTHRDAAECLVTGKQAHYLFTVKANKPTLLARCQRLPRRRIPVRDTSRDRGHGRIEHRTLKAVTVYHLGCPHTAQVLPVTRKTRAQRTRGGGR